jgi:hypothetical protein
MVVGRVVARAPAELAQVRPFGGVADSDDLAVRPVDPRVGDIAHPRARRGVEVGQVQLLRRDGCGDAHPEVLANVAHAPLHLPFRARPIRPAKGGREAVGQREIGEAAG